jgi:hypothetical protein
MMAVPEALDIQTTAVLGVHTAAVLYILTADMLGVHTAAMSKLQPWWC